MINALRRSEVEHNFQVLCRTAQENQVINALRRSEVEHLPHKQAGKIFPASDQRLTAIRGRTPLTVKYLTSSAASDQRLTAIRGRTRFKAVSP